MIPRTLSCWLFVLLLSKPAWAELSFEAMLNIPNPHRLTGCLCAVTGGPEALSFVGKAIAAGNLRAAGASPLANLSDLKARDRSRGTNLVRLKGYSLGDDTGPFLGLGASYFQALRHAKYDRVRLTNNLAFLASKGFNYVRVLSMVNWDGLEIAPVTFTNSAAHGVQAWPDYWQHFRDLLDLVAQHGLRVEVTVFADAQYIMPAHSARLTHLDGILKNIAGREHQLLHLEVANEAWQNGFPGVQGVADLRAFTQYLADQTDVPVAITSNDDTSNQGILSLYQGSAADLATVHFTRDTRTVEGGWLPVRDAYRAGHLPGVPPVSSNEPIGPGSSVSSETDPIKLCSAAVFAYLASWVRNDGLEPSTPFSVFCNGQSDRYWPDVSGPTNGCHRNIGSAKGDRFVCFPMGILGGGLTLQVRRPLTFQVFNPLTGAVVSNPTLTAGNRFVLPQGPGAYLLKGAFLETNPPPPTVSVGQPVPAWLPKAPHLPPPQGGAIHVANVDELLAAVDRVGPGGTILLADGQYRLPRVIVLQQKKDIAIRSASGDPAKVTLSGKGWDSQDQNDDLLHIGRCEGVTLADVTFTDCRSSSILVCCPRDEALVDETN